MIRDRPIRWGIMSTANIARTSFLPGLQAAGGGTASAVAGRDPDRTRSWAAEQGVDRALVGYQELIEDATIDAIYVALPNALHAEWTVAALEAGKTVLCEKPLCISLEETKEVLTAARETGGLLWEAFFFPFRGQESRLHELIETGVIGEVREIQSGFHFAMRNRKNIRLVPELGGGALNDVGCYPIHFAGDVFGSHPEGGVAVARWAPEGVDEEMQGVLTYSDDRRLLFSCGMTRSGDMFSRVLGTGGEIRLTNPFHPREEDTLEIRPLNAEPRVEHVAGSEPSFAPMIQHIHAVLRGEEQPRHLAVEDSLGTAQGLEIARRGAAQRRGGAL